MVYNRKIEVAQCYSEGDTYQPELKSELKIQTERLSLVRTNLSGEGLGREPRRDKAPFLDLVRRMRGGETES